MATNLLSFVTQFLTPEVITRIASALGLDRAVSQKVIAAAIPALLALIGNAASKPGGERQLANALAPQPSGALDTLMSIIGGSGQKSPVEQKSLVESGSSLLSGLLGGSTQDALTRAIGRYAGISEGTSKSMLGMLGPVVLDALGKQQRSAGLDTHDVANLLTSQSHQIAAALPSGFAEQMSAAGLADALGGSVRSGAAAASSAAGRIGSAPAAMANQAAAVARNAQWPYWVLALVALAGFAWLLAHYWSGGEKVTEQTRPPATAAVEPRETVGLGSANLTVAGTNLASEVSSSVGSLQAMLTGIKDEASAQAALPKLREVMLQFDKVSTLSAQLPPEGRRTLARMIATAMPTINSAIERILAVPGAGDVARPAINELRTKLDTLART